MPLIKFSPGDTRVLGLRVGHLLTSDLNATRFADALFDGGFDLCRLKVSADECIDSSVPALEQAGFPYFYAGGILRYRRDYRQRPYTRRYPIPGDLEFVPAGPEHGAQLEQMVREAFGEDPIGYYKTPYLRALFGRDAEVQCLIEFYLREPHPGRSKILVRSGGLDAGFIVMTNYDGTLHTDLLGIRKEHRSRGLFNPMRDFIHLHASEAGLCEEEGARIDNIQSQNLFEEDGLEHFANETVFHVTPFLSRTEVEPLVLELPADRCEALLERALAERLGLGSLRVSRRLHRPGTDMRSGRLRARLRVPVLARDLVVSVAELDAGGGTTPALLYTEYRRVPHHS
jgi:hypothetical protein